jgi:hypothetical protein
MCGARQVDEPTKACGESRAGVGVVEEVEVEALVEVATTDGYKAVQGLLSPRRRGVDGTAMARISVAEVLEGGSIGRVMVPDSEFE